MNAAPANVNGHRERRGTAPIVDAKRLPHNLNAEASILGGIIVKPEVLAELDRLEPDDFYDHRHKIIFQAIRNLEARRKPIDVVTLETEIERGEKLEAVGGIAYLGELALRVPTADNVLAYSDEVRTFAKNRRAIITLHDALERAYSWSGDESDDLVLETARQLQHIEDLHSRGRGPLLKWTTPILEYLGETEPDDDDREDWIIRDLVPRGEPWLLGGPTKAGKTWTMLDLSIALARGEDWVNFENTLGRPARVMSILLEDGKRRLHKRCWDLCRGHGVSFHDPAVLENLRISGEAFYLPDARDERKLIEEAKTFRPDVILADNLTRVMLGESKDERDVKAFAKSWKRINDETGAACGFLHHTRKAGAERGGDPFEALRGDGGILAFARHAIVVLPRRDESDLSSEVHMRGNLDLKRSSFVLGFERRWKNDRWQAKFDDRGNLEDAREKTAESKKEVREEQRRAELETKIERQLSKAVEIATRKGHVTKLEVAVAFGMSSDTGVRRAFDLGVERGRLVQLKGRERNLGYRLAEQTQKGLLT